MKKLTMLIVSSALALAPALLAQTTDPQATPSPAGKKQAKQEAAAQNANASQTTTVNAGGGKAAKMEAKQQRQAEKAAVSQQLNDAKAARKEAKKNNAAVQTSTTTTDSGLTPKQVKQQTKHERKAAKAAVNASASPAGAAAVGQTNTANTVTKTKKLDVQKVETIKTKYATFQAQPRPDKVPAVTFNQSYRISGADQWQGPQYVVFRDYHPEMHDQAFYQSHYGNNVQMIGGGAYYWNNGYWYPAWGYNSQYQYYPYDGPIYVGRTQQPLDRVIANVQAELQEMGYYRGEVDGLLGPLTREALAAYQRDNGLYATAVMDEPTLSSLGLG